MNQLTQGRIASQVFSDRAEQYIAAQMELFQIKARIMAERVAAGLISKVDGVDMLFSAADYSGLLESVGEDRVQAEMARAFLFPEVA